MAGELLTGCSAVVVTNSPPAATRRVVLCYGNEHIFLPTIFGYSRLIDLQTQSDSLFVVLKI